MQKLQFFIAVGVGIFYVTAFVTIDSGEKTSKKLIGPDDWSDYKSWYKITTETNTGDPTGFLQGKHRGTKAFRDIFINDTGKEAYPQQAISTSRWYNHCKRSIQE